MHQVIDNTRRYGSLDGAYMEQIARKVAANFENGELTNNLGGEMSVTPPQDNDKRATLRIVKGLFSVSTTSSKTLVEIEEEIKRVLQENQIQFNQENFTFNCEYNVPDKFCRFQMEICRIQRLTLYGLHLNRVEGDTWVYKTLCDGLTSELKL